MKEKRLEKNLHLHSADENINFCEQKLPHCQFSSPVIIVNSRLPFMTPRRQRMQDEKVIMHVQCAHRCQAVGNGYLQI